MKIKKICVYCGSSPGKNPAFSRAAESLAKILCEREIGLVYGGAAVGVMGAVANAMLEAGGEAIGVIPKSLAVKEVAHDHLTELHVVASMHERKAMMAASRLAESIIGRVTGHWTQLGFHHKPCGLLNVEGYYNGLIGFLENAFEQQFVKALCRPMLMTVREPVALLDQFAAYRAPKVRKWMGEDEL